jgi:hypothetical protein
MAEGILFIFIVGAFFSGLIGMFLGGSVNKGAAGFWLSISCL